MNRRIARIAAALSTGAASVSHAQCITPDAYAQAGGEVQAAAPVATGFAMIGSGPRLEVVSLPAGGTPTRFATHLLPDMITQVSPIAGAFAYVCAGRNVYRFDRLRTVTNPLVLQSSVQVASSGTKKLLAFEPIVYCLTNSSTIEVYDYTTPTAPVLVRTVILTRPTADMVGVNDQLFLTNPDGVQVLSIANRSNPVVTRNIAVAGGCGLLDTFAGGSGFTRLLVEQRSPSGTIRIIDVPDGAGAATLRGSVQPFLGNIRDISQGEVAGNSGIVKLNLNNPDAPTIADRFNSPDGTCFGVGVFNGQSFVAGGEGGLLVLNDASLDLQTRYMSGPTIGAGVALGPANPPDGTIFVASLFGGLRTVHLTSTNVSDLGGIDPGYIPSVSCTGGFLFMVNAPTAAGRAECYTIANPAAPVLRSQYIPNGGALTLSIHGIDARAIVKTFNAGTYSLDLVDFAPATPVLLQHLDIPAPAVVRDVGIHAGHAYVLADNTVRVYSIAPAGLTLVRNVPLGTTNLGKICFDGTRAFVIESTITGVVGNTHVLSLVNPASPSHTRFFAGPTSPFGVAASDGWVAIAGEREVQFLECSDPLHPIEIGRVGMECPATDAVALTLAGDTQFLVATNWCGVQAFHRPPDFTPVIIRPPLPVTTCLGGTAVYDFDARFSNTPEHPVHFQWQRYVNNFAQNIPGETGETLTITNVNAEDAQWNYRVVITNDCGMARSAAGALHVTVGDFNCDGAVSSQDFFDFLSAFFAANPRADINGDGSVNSQDFFDFLAAFFG